MEKTLVIIKPDGVQRRLVGEIIARFEKKGLKIAGLKMMHIDKEIAERHYGAHKGKKFYESLMLFISSSPVVVLALEGGNAIAIVRKMMGKTFGSEAEAGTIRGDFGVSNSFNLVHGSDSPESAETELALFFKPSELPKYDLTDSAWVYDWSKGQPE